MEHKFSIKANVFGKTKYWDFVNGLHSGLQKRYGHMMYASEKEAKADIRKLKKVFHSGIVFSVITHDELPFIKKQRNKRNNF